MPADHFCGVVMVPYLVGRGNQRGSAGSSKNWELAHINRRVNPQLSGLRATKAAYAAWVLACGGRLGGPQAPRRGFIRQPR